MVLWRVASGFRRDEVADVWRGEMNRVLFCSAAGFAQEETQKQEGEHDGSDEREEAVFLVKEGDDRDGDAQSSAWR